MRVLLMIIGLMVSLVVLAGSALAQGGQATAELKNPSGQVVGTATMTQAADGVRLQVQVTNIEPGTHGIHIHAVGKCDPPDFASAGGHFNPGGKQHGLQNPQGAHAGDLPNLNVGANRAGSLTATNNMITLGTGANSLFDADGSAVVIHANADDEKTDPTGNSGGRVACGVIQRVVTTMPTTGADASIGWLLAVLGVVTLLTGLATRQARRVA